MFKWLFSLFAKGDEKTKPSKKRNGEIPDRYYKILVQKYYGLQGAEWEYRKAMKISDFNYFNPRDFDWVIIGYYSNVFDCFSSYTYVMPSGGIEILEQEYIEATKLSHPTHTRAPRIFLLAHRWRHLN